VEHKNANLKKIFKLSWSTEEIFFKSFEHATKLPDGLNFTHVKAIMNLNHGGPQCMSSISKKLVMEKGSFTTVAQKIISKGYVEKIQDEGDKRRFRLNLTDKGNELAERIKIEHLAHINAIIKTFSDEEKDEYFALMEKLSGYNTRLIATLNIK